MSAPARKMVNVDLGPLAEKAEARVRAGDYPSVDEVVREGLRALEREEAMLDSMMPPIPEGDPEWDAYVRRKVQESLDDPRPSIPAAEVRRHLRELHEARVRRDG
ncbi:MAG: type II toxin-antitoxin system ParD family antitoxin [Alphaproteobacteria bacterium]|nr:MAG: type II toxin-antitoxin system ParD family antitoxin [Alphaproteobacteria bacterium]